MPLNPSSTPATKVYLLYDDQGEYPDLLGVYSSEKDANDAMEMAIVAKGTRRDGTKYRLYIEGLLSVHEHVVGVNLFRGLL